MVLIVYHFLKHIYQSSMPKHTLKVTTTSSLTSSEPLLSYKTLHGWCLPKIKINNKRKHNSIQRGQRQKKNWVREIKVETQVHEVTCVYVSNRQMYADTGRWEDVLGYSWVWAVISWPLNWSRCSAENPRGPSQIWLARSPQPADDKNCSSQRANLHRMLLCIYIYIYILNIYIQ